MNSNNKVINKFKNKIIICALGISMLASSVGTSGISFASTTDTSVKTSVGVTPTVPLTQTTFAEYYPDSALNAAKSDSVVEAKVQALIKTMTQEEKFGLLGGNGTGLQGNAGYLKGVPRLGVPESKMYDGPAGVLSLYDTTNPPQEQMLAATWDKSLAYDYGVIHGAENKAIGGNIQLGSQYDITRVPQFGRAKDQLGEDPYLLSSLSSEETKGIQDQNVVAVLKHFAAFSQNATPGTQTNIVVSEQALHEIHLPGFESAIKEGGGAGVMSSYNMINGTFASSNSYLQLDVLRDMWGFTGFTVTDWGGNDGFTLNKGTDIEMPSLSNNSQAKAEQMIASGEITQETVDNAAGNVLRALGQVGYLGLVKIDSSGYAYEESGRTTAIILKEDLTELAQVREESSTTSKEVAEKGGVLLKNEKDSLPLDTSNGKTVAVIGLNGMNLISGVDGERSFGTLNKMKSPYEGLVTILGSDKVEGEVAMDIVGEAIPATNLYLDATGTVKGVKRTYGTGASQGSSSDEQGQIKTAGSIAATKMGTHEIGEDTGIVDSNINFTTGTINGKPNKTYKIDGADEGTATAFTKESGAAYTWTTYIQAPESGEYSIMLNGIGGAAAASIQTGVDAEGKAVSQSLGISSINQGTQWPSNSVIPTETGMSITSAKVTLEAGKRYKVMVAGIAKLEQKDLQVSLAWITPSQKTANYSNALKAAEDNDTVVLFAYRKTTDVAATREATTCRLDSAQEQLILDVAEKAHAKGNKVVVVLNNSTAVTMENWIDKVDGLLEMYFPGQEGGTATAELLTGKVNPSGKLAFTIPKKDTDTIITYSDENFARYTVKEKGPEKPDSYWEAMMKMFNVATIAEAKAFAASMGMDGTINTSNYDEGIMSGYRWYDEMGIEPQYDFGYGLSYTTFEYSNTTVTKNSKAGENVGYDVTFTVKNTGDVTGSEVAQVYLGKAVVPSGVQSAKYQLAAYKRLDNMEAGESRTVTLHLTERSLSYWNTNAQLQTRSDGTKDKWSVATGTRNVYVGSSSDYLIANKTINVSVGNDPAPTATPTAKPTVAPTAVPTPAPTAVPSAPAQVSGVKTGSVTTNTIVLSWNKADKATSYAVLKYDSGKKQFTSYKTTATTSLKVTGLSAGKVYRFKVVAYNGTLKGTESTVLKAATDPKKLTLKAKKTTSTKAKLTWKSTNANYVVVYMKKGSGRYKPVAKVKAGKKLYVKTGLKKGTKYSFKIRGYKLAGNIKSYSAYSAVKSVK